MPDIPDEEWDQLTRELDEMVERVTQLAGETTRIAEQFNLAIGKARPAITLDQARRLQRQIRETEAWLQGAAKLLDPEFPVDWDKEGE